MGRAPCCSKVGLHRGPWTAKEDSVLIKHIQAHGEGNWRALPRKAGLLRCGKSCRLRWMNYLRPGIRRGNFGPDEEDMICRLHALLGNRWSLIAGRLPGRTDNEIKNYWNTHLSKKLRWQGTTLLAQKTQTQRPGSGRRRSKKNIKLREENIIVEPVKTPVHLPRPVRLTSFQKYCSAMGARCCSANVQRSQSDRRGTVGGEFEFIAPYFSQLTRALGDDNEEEDDLELETHLGYQTHTPMQMGSLEKLYEEYLEILTRGEEGALPGSLGEE